MKGRNALLTHLVFKEERREHSVVGYYRVKRETVLHKGLHGNCVKFMESHREEYGLSSARMEETGGVVPLNFSAYKHHVRLMKWARKQEWYAEFLSQQNSSIRSHAKYANALYDFLLPDYLTSIYVDESNLNS